MTMLKYDLPASAHERPDFDPLAKGQEYRHGLPAAFGLGGVSLGRDVPLRGGPASTLARIP